MYMYVYKNIFGLKFILNGRRTEKLVKCSRNLTFNRVKPTKDTNSHRDSKQPKSGGKE